jgi:hypothetical protein
MAPQGLNFFFPLFVQALTPPEDLGEFHSHDGVVRQLHTTATVLYIQQLGHYGQQILPLKQRKGGLIG